ncbi:MAG: DUF1501 domain-containing protein [Bacteroidota bacterium]|jgi:uncharacterized protein (DUF1501 family)|nr:DUF1501 domain-containing protein [Cytophagales bacterium]MCE2957263.1 DUF1501 domain-containing protein [Flammeovirgaceae bacterium]MCZ8069017.1 DUF1501 domain-containing protein [Cytophagales bacterium]
MKRRDFIKSLSMAAVPITLGGIPLKVMAENSLTRMASQSTNDRVLVILQMHGGNDGLNAIIPVTDYDLYYSRRPNIAIPLKNSARKMIKLDSTLPPDAQVGLHPDMGGMKDLYDRGRMAVVQGVSYKNNNGSHFRGRDISFMGGSFDDYFSSGWVGRYLQQEFAPKTYPAEFPNADMLDPLAIEMGSDVSLIFHQDGNIPTSISINDPKGFADLVQGLKGFQDQGVDPRGYPPAALLNSPYGKELSWILGLEEKSKDYAQRLYDVYKAASATAVTYPERYPFNAPTGSLNNPLSSQLQLVARLLDGGGAGKGVKTKVFLVKIGGFDTHAEQVESYDPTMGGHAALMYHISSAMQAFQNDLRLRGIEDRVLTVTTSEFGRRVHSNGSYGTDHGTGGPVYIFGKGVKPGVTGKVPDLTQDNVDMQYDYRQVYASLLRDWMLVDENKINNDIFFKNFLSGPKEEGTGNYENIVLAEQVISGVQENFVAERFGLLDCFPNPAKESTTVRFRINNTSHVTINLLDNSGKQLKTVISEEKTEGEHSVKIELSDVPPGFYLYQLKTGFVNESKKLIVTK